MQITKNRIISALVVLLLISAVWGQMKTGQNKDLIRRNNELQTQLKSGKDAAASCSSLRTEISKERDAKKQTEERLNNMQAKLDDMSKAKAAAEAKAAELEKIAQDAEAAKNSQSAEQQQHLVRHQARIEELHQQIAHQQAVLDDQQHKLDSAAKVIEREQQQVKSCGERVAELDRLRAERDELEEAGQQLEEERNKVLAETDTLRAQVIGLEKIVEERSASLGKTDKELENCKLNNEILIGQIAQVKQEPVKKNTLPAMKNKAEQQAPATPQQLKPVPPVQQRQQ